MYGCVQMVQKSFAATRLRAYLARVVSAWVCVTDSLNLDWSSLNRNCMEFSIRVLHLGLEWQIRLQRRPLAPGTSQSNAPEYSTDNEQSLIFSHRDSRASETQAPVKIIPRERGETPGINPFFFTWVLNWNVPVRPLLYVVYVTGQIWFQVEWFNLGWFSISFVS